jgi:BirA family biotin operon repressor/biotin-[acetyl-CoA-carboxylase] ligase
MFERFHFSFVSSTNDYAKELLNEQDRVVVTTDNQTLGRGRNNKTWSGDQGMNVYCSFAVRHSSPVSQDKLLAFQSAGTLASLMTLRNITQNSFSNVKLLVKYPNDILACVPEKNVFTTQVKASSAKKLSGILIEHEFVGQQCMASIVGIGINVLQKEFPEELAQKATSLSLIGVSTDVDTVSEQLIEQFTRFIQLPPQELFVVWKKELAIEGRNIRLVDSLLEWEVKELCKDGRLLVEDTVSQQQRFVDNGDSIVYTNYFT